MAYLLFYITPEELTVYQEAQEDEILKGDNLVTWQKHDIEEPFRYIYLCYSLVLMIPAIPFYYLIGFEVEVGAMISYLLV